MCKDSVLLTIDGRVLDIRERIDGRVLETQPLGGKIQ
jgi:hypothetical protein